MEIPVYPVTAIPDSETKLENGHTQLRVMRAKQKFVEKMNPRLKGAAAFLSMLENMAKNIGVK